MSLFRSLSLTLIAATSMFTATVDAASVWKVTSGENSLFIGGTIHILAPEDYPLPNEYNIAYQKASTLVFETDMAALKSAAFQQKMLGMMTYTDGRSLEDDLSANSYAKLEAHLSERGIPIAQMAAMKPSLISITLSVIELQGLGFTSEGVDQFYADKASQESKAIKWLETPDEQLGFLANMGGNDNDALIDYTLRDITKMPAIIADMRTSWREGDMQKMAEISIVPFKADYGQIYQDLLVTRNANWMPQIEDMLKTAEVEFIMVGAMHLAGEDSVLTQLKTQGYSIEKL
ncbi:TraB/GumN family protein [Paraglaciecola sp. 20A4]|uniref:TraB/GumN family protein n=1 Tax=Paraglaciecola sp. 20A4 TaxID=2687288 RepID=UPI00140B4DD7|nr:TraB/GumN family protein [Paraglaciecola sp. 20A4]